MNQTSTTSVRQQNFMHALRMAMGLPLHRLTNDVAGYGYSSASSSIASSPPNAPTT